MDRADRSESLDDFLFQAKQTGRMMARSELDRGGADAQEIMATIASICRDVSVDWGLPPAAVEAGVRAYLDGARALLAKHNSPQRRRENHFASTEGSTASPPVEGTTLSPPAAAVVVQEGPPAGSATIWLEELRQLCTTTSELTSESRRLVAELRDGLEQLRNSRARAQLSLETIHATASESKALLGRMREMLASTQASFTRAQEALTPSRHEERL